MTSSPCTAAPLLSPPSRPRQQRRARQPARAALEQCTRRDACLLAAGAALSAALGCPSTARSAAALAPVVTTRVFFDFATEQAPLGRLVLGIYGGLLPVSSGLFLRLIESGAYRGSSFSQIHPGAYVLGGLDASLPEGFPRTNSDVVSPSAFALDHSRPGTLSLVLSAVSGEGKLGRMTTGFRITTGPGPAPQLDGSGIVIGRVQEGWDTLDAIAHAPTYAPPPNSPLLAYNQLAGAFGDARSATARTAWSKPRNRIVITDCGIWANGAPDLSTTAE